MKKIHDIKQRSFLFALAVIEMCRQIQKNKKEYLLSKQLMRSGTAVGALIREAQNAESDKDFIHKMAIAQKECDETIYWLDLIVMSKMHNNAPLIELKEESTQLLKIIRTIILNKKENMKRR